MTTDLDQPVNCINGGTVGDSDDEVILISDNLEISNLDNMISNNKRSFNHTEKDDEVIWLDSSQNSVKRLRKSTSTATKTTTTTNNTQPIEDLSPISSSQKNLNIETPTPTNEIDNKNLIYSHRNEFAEFKVEIGSILDCSVDAIANSVEPSIHWSLNFGITAELVKIIGQTFLGQLLSYNDLKFIENESVFQMAYTCGHNFVSDVKFNTVFHCHIPDYDYINEKSEIIYKNTLKHMFQLANTYKLKSLAIPVIGCEKKRYPPKLIARLFDESVKTYMSTFNREFLTLKSIKIIVDSRKTYLIDEFIKFYRNDANDLSINTNSILSLLPPFTSHGNFKLHLIPPNTDEFLIIRNHFMATMNTAIIKSIERVDNSELEDLYNNSKKYVASRQKINQPIEYNLFHGSSWENIKLICNSGFNRSYCGINGTVYGNGVYFARRASYSHSYSVKPFFDLYSKCKPRCNCKSKCKKFDEKSFEYTMIVAKVLVGAFQDYKLTNMKDTGLRPDGLPYDSAVDNPADPSIFVIYRDYRALPNYIIKYTVNSVS